VPGDQFHIVQFFNKQLQRIFEHPELPQALLDKRKTNDRSYSMHWELKNLKGRDHHRNEDKYMKIVRSAYQRNRMMWNGFM
jgi:hypothetical protein